MRSPELTRRTMMATAAWGVPTILVATAAPTFAASTAVDLGIGFDYDYWEQRPVGSPQRVYVCTNVWNQGTTSTTGAFTVSLTAPADVTGEFYTPYGMVSIPTTWQLHGEQTNTLTVTIPDPLAAGQSFHISYWWTVPDSTVELPLTASISGGGEGPGDTGNNADTTTSVHAV